MKAHALSENIIPAIVRLIRVKQWVKNLFLFVPIFFAGKLFQVESLLSLAMGFIAFSFVASAVYVLNDANDIESDRIHPEKCKRPLASGEIGLSLAFGILFILLISGLSLAWMLSLEFFFVLSAYVVINIAYSFGLKHVALLDLFIIALGFLLRVIGGGILAAVPISEWLVIMVFLLAMFLALAKRRDDVVIFQGQTSYQ